VVDEVAVRRALALIASRSLSGREARILCAITAETAGSGRESQRLTSVEIASRCRLRQRHVRTLMGRLEKRGLIVRVPDGNSYQVSVADGERPVGDDALPPEFLDVAPPASGPTEAEALLGLAEAARELPAPEPPPSQAVLDLERLVGVEIREQAFQLERSGELGRDLLQRLVSELRVADRTDDGRVLTPAGPVPIEELAVEELTRRLRTAAMLVG
jgi:ribosomal protein S19E (S16A)